MFIVDSGNRRIRKVNNTTGYITTIAGTGTASSTGDNGPATLATLNGAYGVALDTSGTMTAIVY